MPSAVHWTEEKPENFVFYIASDFIDRLQEAMDAIPMSKRALAKKLGVSAGRISQIFHNPGNLTLEMIVRCARAVGIKVGLLSYDDGDKENRRGPILPEVFLSCWTRAGKPLDMSTFTESTPALNVGVRLSETSLTIDVAVASLHQDRGYFEAATNLPLTNIERQS